MPLFDFIKEQSRMYHRDKPIDWSQMEDTNDTDETDVKHMETELDEAERKVLEDDAEERS